MVSMGGVQFVAETGALMQHEHSESSQGCSTGSAGAASWQQEVLQQDCCDWTVSTGVQQEVPAAVLTMQQHRGITAAVSSAMKRDAGCRFRMLINT